MTSSEPKRDSLRVIFLLILFGGLIVFPLLLGLFEIGVWFAARYLAAWDRGAIAPVWKNVVYDFYMEDVRNILQYQPDCAQFDARLSYSMRPGSCRFQNWDFDTRVSSNSLGFRDDEGSLIKPEIVVMGDSFSIGWGVNDDETFSSRLEKISGKRVLNTAGSSYGTAREVLALERVDTSNVKTFVIQYCPNDYDENLAFVRSDPPFKTMSEETYLKLAADHRHRQRYWPLKYTFELIPAYLEQQTTNVARPQPVYTTPRAFLFLEVLKRSPLLLERSPVEATSEAGATPRILVFSLLPDDFPAELRSFLAREEYRQFSQNIIPIDITLSDTLSGNAQFNIDEHLTPEGHRQVAEQLLPYLENRDFLQTRMTLGSLQ